MKACFVGDVSPTPVTDAAFAAGDIKTLFGNTLPLFRGQDVCVGNLECALTTAETPIEKFGPNIKGTPHAARVLAEVGFTHVGLSNNHFYDFGPGGVAESMQALDAAGIGYTGFGANYEDSRRTLFIEKAGECLALIAVCEHEYTYALENRMGCRPFDEFDTIEDIRQAKSRADRVVVMYHGGKEHCQYPSPRLRRVCRAMVRAGADLVLCQHSHCIGCYEAYRDGHILYGQGNFHFVKPHDRVTWFDELVCHYDTKANTVEFIPIYGGESGIALSEGERKEQVLQAFAARNASLQDGSWEKGWEAFCDSMRKQYVGIVGGAGRPDSTDFSNHAFAHYLDCEAHTDVWRTLFRTSHLKMTPSADTTIAFLGDSITLGYALDDRKERYSTKVCQKLGVREENYGITGTLVSRAGLNRTDNKAFLDRLHLIRTADVAVIFGGTNDYFWSDEPIAGFETSMREMCKVIKADRSGKKTLLVTPYPHHGIGNYQGGAFWKDSSEHDTSALNFNGSTLKEYVDVIEAVGREYGIPVLNLHKVAGFDWTAHTVDGCHPNSAGHDWLAEQIANAITNL